MPRKSPNLLQRLHANDSGNIAVLMIFAGWIFLGLIAMIWNAGEFGARRRHMQMAADSAANAAEVWRARTMNVITGSNMVIGEIASAEILFRTIDPTYQQISNRLTSEQVAVDRSLQQIAVQLAANAKAKNPDPNLALSLGLQQAALTVVKQTIPLEQNEIADFHSITSSVYDGFTKVDDFAQQRHDIFNNFQKPAVDNLQQDAQTQLANISDAFRCDIVYATTARINTTPDFGSAKIKPPLMRLNDPEGDNADDPVTWEDVNIPPLTDPTPVAGLNGWDRLATDTYNNGTVKIQGGQWGEIDDPPMNRFVADRAYRDANGRNGTLMAYLINIDKLRTTLRQNLIQLLTPPAKASASEIAIYRQVLATVTGVGAAAPWYDPNGKSFGWQYGTAFAQDFYSATLANNTRLVLINMGNDPQYVLATYGRYDIPSWAEPLVYQSAYQNVHDKVYAANRIPVLLYEYNEILKDLQANPGGQTLAQLQRQAQQQALQLAPGITEEGARKVAFDVASVWTSTPAWWPYEITPPQTAEPMPPGINDDDRLRLYSIVAGAKSNDLTNAKPLIPGFFGKPQTLVAYAQAETFNWMEYNGSQTAVNNSSWSVYWQTTNGGYGASDNYTTWLPPLPWRISTRGGMSWNPRLASADGLANAMKNNAEFNYNYMGPSPANVTNVDPAALNTLNQH